MLRTVRFRTEAAPSQDRRALRRADLAGGSRRLGRALLPGPLPPVLHAQEQWPDPARIYRRHYGADVLRSEIVDIHGTPLAPEIVDTIDIGSSPLDETFEDVVRRSACRTRSTSRGSDRRLAGAAGHGARLLHAADRPEARRHRAALVAVVPHLGVPDLRGPRRVRRGPARRRAGVAGRRRAARRARRSAASIGAAQSGAAPGRDALVEAIYRDLLGIDGGSLRRHFGVPDADFAGHIIGRRRVGREALGHGPRARRAADRPARACRCPTSLRPMPRRCAAQGLYLVVQGRAAAAPGRGQRRDTRHHPQLRRRGDLHAVRGPRSRSRSVMRRATSWHRWRDATSRPSPGR